MKRRALNLLLLAVAATVLAVAPAWAKHGRLETTDRDAWINDQIAQLTTASAGDIERMTNLEAAQFTYEMAGTLLAQAKLRQILDAPPDKKTPTPEPQPTATPSSKKPDTPVSQPAAAQSDKEPVMPVSEPIAVPSDNTPAAPKPQPTVAPAPRKTMSLEGADPALVKLVEEFRQELSAMGLDLDKWDDRISEMEVSNEEINTLQREYLKRTGTQVSGMLRGFFNIYRGFGNYSVYPAMGINSFGFTEVRLKSVPVPFILFDARMRLTRTFGRIYGDPITPNYELRWLQLSALPEAASFTAGDFYKSYTPLTLWNPEIPVYTLLEPTSFKRTRKDVEDLVYMDKGPDWHLRGFQASTAPKMPDNPVVDSFNLHAMAGQIGTGSNTSFGSYFAGGQGGFSFAQGKGYVTGTGLILWDDPSTTGLPYIPSLIPTLSQQYQIGSGKAGINIPFTSDVTFAASGEYAASFYQQDQKNPLTDFKDWALLADASLDVFMVKAKFKLMDIGPFYYSPGAQTARFSTYAGAGYLGSNLNRDEALPGYLNNYVFQNVTQPTFAFYDRLDENIFPYGDCTPNRQGFTGGLSADLGDGGWLQPQVLYTWAEEIRSNDVVGPAGVVYAADGGVPIFDMPLRTFTGVEGAITLDFAKFLALKGKTYSMEMDYKHQETTWNMDLSPFTVNTAIAGVDFSVPIEAISSIVLSGALKITTAQGNEYVYYLGNPGTFAAYPYYLDGTALGTYIPLPLNLTRTTWSWGIMYPLSKAIRFKADWFITNYTWTDVPTYDRRDQIMRFTYEASF
jgi:hypothetical protein